mgnify:CR=1 FL=1
METRASFFVSVLRYTIRMLHPHQKPEPITYFGQTDSRGRRTPFGIKEKDRSRHMYVIGKTGMGKSTLLENMAIQDIQNGHGVCFIDPHGKTADLLLDYVPENRIKDVLYFAPFDMNYPISFNIMEDVGADKRHLVVNGLMATFEKIWVDAWSARMAYILQNTLLALLEYPDSTLLGVNRMLVDKEYRKLIVANISDPSCRSFWVDEFAKYTDRYTQEATPAIQNKVGQFTANPLIRNLVGQPKSTFDLRKLMDEKKIIIVNLSKGKVGEGNANLLGSMFITKVYLAAMSRADVTETELQKLPNFYLYVDEFQSFANKSFADILSEARKYKLNLTLAHQYIEQMEEEVSAAVFGNVGTMAVFRVGAFDAEFLEKEFAPALLAEDLVNLGIYQIYIKLMIDGVTSAPFSAVTIPPIERPAVSYREQVIATSRAHFARSRDIVEKEIKEWHLPIVPAPKERSGALRESAPRTSPPRDERDQSDTKASPPERTPHAPVSDHPRDFVRHERRDVPLPHSDRRPPLHHDVASGREPHHVPTVPAPAPVPLASLRPGAKKAQTGGAHSLGGTRDSQLSELRKALSQVLEQSTQNTPFAPSEENAAAPSNAQPKEQHAEQKRPQPPSARGGEVPEDMLRKLLEVENPAEKQKEANHISRQDSASTA